MRGTKSSSGSRVENRANDIVVYGEIGGQGTLTAEQLRTRIDEIESAGHDSINVRLNSYGGDVFEGLAMSHALATSPLPVTVHVDGIAASIASVIAVSGGSVQDTVMASSAQFMIHNSWTELRFVGDSSALAEGAKSLEKMTGVLSSIDTQIVSAYAQKTNLPEQTLRDYMGEETWFDAPTAKRLGFVDRVVESNAVAACAIPVGLFRKPSIFGERRVRRDSVDAAEGAIRAGNYNRRSDWAFSSSDGNALLGSDGDDWNRFGKAHLAMNEEAEPDTKARFSYPFAKLVAGELVVFRAALNAIRSRSAAEDDGNIFDAAGRLIDLMDDRTEVDNRARRKLAIEKMRLKLLVPRWPMR
jgi:ATP-dependent protease ClpP protease subunit